jgi:hypothetical protein
VLTAICTAEHIFSEILAGEVPWFEYISNIWNEAFKLRRRRMINRCLLGSCSVVLTILLLSEASLAQRTTADIRGTVSDQTAAVIAGAKVTVTNQAT